VTRTDQKETTQPIWFKGTAADSWVTRFTVGDDYLWDTILLPYDIAATRAHARGLETAGMLTESEFEAISVALDGLAQAVDYGRITVQPEDEDSHTVIEAFVTEHAGSLGKKLQTGRSRNDQVLASIRLFLRDALDRISGAAHRVINDLCDLADRNGDLVIPGYTHLQRAMPSTVALWAMGFAELFIDDIRALGHARSQINRSPLGSAAGYGVPYMELDREGVAKELGFDSIQEHVTAVQLSRGKQETHVVHALVQLATTVNRLASDLVLYNSREYGFVTLPDEFCTGSSIMPQKKNPDVFELCRATVHRISAEMQLLMTLSTNLPSGYHRDLQLTKEAVMRSVVKTDELMEAVTAIIPGIRFNPDRIKEAVTPELFATAAALEAVEKGASFRDAYRDVAQDTDAWERAANRPISETYRNVGFPGKSNVSGVRIRAQEALDSVAGPTHPENSRKNW